MNPSPEQIRQSLFALTAKGIKYDLERIAAAAKEVGNPHAAYQSIHVAGTNGKGSTCAYLESILLVAGFTTGLFTSPHIAAFEERFRINGEMVAEEEWVDVYHRQRSVIESFNLTFFEATMLMACELFRRRGVEWAVFETGLGGRLDATNIIRPCICVITRLAMDHREYLGNTLAEIAGEKLGIVKQKTPLVIEDPHDPDLRRLIANVCGSREAPCTFVSLNDAQSIEESVTGNRWRSRDVTWENRLSGKYQIINALLAIEAILQSVSIDIPTIRRGIVRTVLSGRFQRISADGRPVIIDVGHNPDAAAVLCETLRRHFHGSSICFVIGIMADKDYNAMIALYASIGRHFIFTRPKTDRAAKAEKLAGCLSEEKRTVCPDVGEAIDIALGRGEEVVCITGSFYTVGEAMEKLRALRIDTVS